MSAKVVFSDVIVNPLSERVLSVAILFTMIIFKNIIEYEFIQIKTQRIMNKMRSAEV